jgi:hypothetical protein
MKNQYKGDDYMKRLMILASLLLLVNFIAGGAILADPQHAADEKTPESVRAAFPGAQTFTKQHRDLSPADIAAIEKASGTRWSGDRDFHSYLAIGTKNGRRAQLGAATVVENVSGAGDLTIAYDNDLTITKVTASKSGGDATSAGFLSQFVGKGHDDSIKLGQDIKYSGSDRATAAAITDAVRRATHTMQRLYGKAHQH